MLSLSESLIATKNEFLVPCVYHFYKRPPVLVRGEGVYLFDSDGKKYLDCFSGVTVVSAGHSNPEIIKAAIDQLLLLQHTTTIYLTKPMLDLARMIAELAPGNLSRSFFCASGTEANEGALLLSTLVTGRNEVIYLKDGLHGRTKWAMSVTGAEMWRTDPYPLVTANVVPGPREPASLYEIEKILKQKKVAAIIAEPIQGNGGIIVPHEDYWPSLRRLCDVFGTLLIADEIQTAWNRTGQWFATNHWNVVPDIVTVAKALGNGFPIAAYITTNEIASYYKRPGAATFGGNLVSCRAAIATLNFHKTNELGKKSFNLGCYLKNSFLNMQKRFSLIKEIRGIGLMLGMELNDSAENTAAILTDRILEEMKDAGFLIGKTGPGRNVLTFMPPLVITSQNLDSLIENLCNVFENLK